MGKRYCRLYIPCDVYEELAKFAAESFGKQRVSEQVAAVVVKAGLAALKGSFTPVSLQPVKKEKVVEAAAAASKKEKELKASPLLQPASAPPVQQHAAVPAPPPASQPPSPSSTQPAARQPGGEEKKRARRDGFSILEEEGFMEESRVVGRVRDSRAFFASLVRRGALLIPLKVGFLVVHPSFWERFKRDLQLCKPTDFTPLDEKERALYMALARRAAVSYGEKGWQLPSVQTGEEALKILGVKPEDVTEDMGEIEVEETTTTTTTTTTSEPVAAPTTTTTTTTTTKKPVATTTTTTTTKGGEEGEEGGGFFLFKCPLCGLEVKGGGLAEVGVQAGKHLWKDHGVLVGSEDVLRYISHVSG